MTIHAFTELHNDYPAYVNLSEQKDGAIKLSVRTRGNGGKDYATIDLTAAQAEELADSIYKHVYKDEAQPKAAPVAEGCPECGCVGLHACPGSPMKEWTPEEVTNLNSVLAEYAPVPVAEAPTVPNAESARDWSEDFPHENGNYQNKCNTCEKLFMGHKRRGTCKLCAAPATEQAKAEPFTTAQLEMIEQEVQRRATECVKILNRADPHMNGFFDDALGISGAQAAPVKPDLSDQDILKLVCDHTGKRISLNVEECGQHIDFARALLAAITKEPK